MTIALYRFYVVDVETSPKYFVKLYKVWVWLNPECKEIVNRREYTEENMKKCTPLSTCLSTLTYAQAEESKPPRCDW
jgi:hypothetical protein